MTAAWIILMIPLAGLIMYQQIGTPEAINLAAVKPQPQNNQQQAHATQQNEMDDLVESLQKRLSDSPDDPEGWIILGRTLKTTQRYEEAETALRNANRLRPDDPMVMVELAEASLFASGRPRLSRRPGSCLNPPLPLNHNTRKACG